MKQIKTIVNENFKTMKPYVERDKGEIPPMLFFQFSSINEDLALGLKDTTGGDTILVKNGFYVPMTSPELMMNQTIFFNFMNMVMSSLSILGIVGEMEFVSIALSGQAAVVKKDKRPTDDDFIEVYIVSGIDKNGKAFTMSRELKAKVVGESVVYELVDTTSLPQLNKEEALFVSDIFDGYNNNIETAKGSGTTKEELTANMPGVEDVATFVQSLIEDSIEATKVTSEAMKSYGN